MYTGKVSTIIENKMCCPQEKWLEELTLNALVFCKISTFFMVFCLDSRLWYDWEDDKAHTCSHISRRVGHQFLHEQVTNHQSQLWSGECRCEFFSLNQSKFSVLLWIVVANYLSSDCWITFSFMYWI